MPKSKGVRVSPEKFERLVRNLEKRFIQKKGRDVAMIDYAVDLACGVIETHGLTVAEGIINQEIELHPEFLRPVRRRSGTRSASNVGAH
jgi:hypothetical protein